MGKSALPSRCHCFICCVQHLFRPGQLEFSFHSRRSLTALTCGLVISLTTCLFLQPLQRKSDFTSPVAIPGCIRFLCVICLVCPQLHLFIPPVSSRPRISASQRDLLQLLQSLCLAYCYSHAPTSVAALEDLLYVSELASLQPASVIRWAEGHMRLSSTMKTRYQCCPRERLQLQQPWCARNQASQYDWV